jgi:hypothetical protein
MIGTIQCMSGLADHPNQKRQLNKNVSEYPENQDRVKIAYIGIQKAPTKVGGSRFSG